MCTHVSGMLNTVLWPAVSAHYADVYSTAQSAQLHCELQLQSHHTSKGWEPVLEPAYILLEYSFSSLDNDGKGMRHACCSFLFVLYCETCAPNMCAGVCLRIHAKGFTKVFLTTEMPQDTRRRHELAQREKMHKLRERRLLQRREERQERRERGSHLKCVLLAR